MKDKYVFSFTSLISDGKVFVEIVSTKNAEDPRTCGRLVMSPAEWDLFEATLRAGPSRFLDEDVKLLFDNSRAVIEAIKATKPWLDK